jgi:plastocyanin
MRRKLLIAAGGALMAAGLGIGLTAVPAGAGVTPVSIFGTGAGNQGYDPAKVLIPKKSKVTWTNDGSVDHTVTKDGGGFSSGTLDPGETYTKKFKKLKVYRYHCSIHPDMEGKVKVIRPS